MNKKRQPFLDKRFSIEGSEMNDFVQELKSFRERTIYQPMFNFKDVFFYHIDKDIGKHADFIEVYPCKSAITNLNSHYPLENACFLKKAFLSKELLRAISNGEITTCFVYHETDEHKTVAFLDENARSVIAAKCGFKGSIIYTNDYLSDINLQALCENYSAQKDLPFGVYRKCEDVNLFISVVSRQEKLIDLMTIEEMNTNQLVLMKYKITNYRIVAEFEGKAVGDYIPSIRVYWSDAGKGFFKRVLCVKPNDGITQRSSIIKDLNSNTTVTEAMDEFKKIALQKRNTVVKRALQKLKHDKKFSSIGDKRIANIVNPMLKDITDENEFFLKALTLPDVIGEINETTDLNLEQSLGEFFYRGIA